MREATDAVRPRPLPSYWDFDQDDIDALGEAVRSAGIDNLQAVKPRTHEFEEKFARQHGLERCLTVSSGTAAMHTSVGALALEPGDEIIVSPWTAGGSIIGALFLGCIPVFADVDDTYNLDPDDVEAKITPRTRAIIAVHLFGNPCEMSRLREIAEKRRLFLIEDCSQAIFAEHQGQRIGTLGDVAGFSFVGEHLSAGFGGAVLTADAALHRRASRIRTDTGYQINEPVAALLLSQLRKLDGYVESKIRGAKRIIDLLDDVEEVVPQCVRSGNRHSYYILAFTVDTERLTCNAREFADALCAEGIPFGGPYIESGRAGPLYRNPFLTKPACFGHSHFPFDCGREKPIDYRLVECPRGEELLGRSIVTMMWPSLTDDDCADIARAIRRVAARHLRGRRPERLAPPT